MSPHYLAHQIRLFCCVGVCFVFGATSVLAQVQRIEQEFYANEPGATITIGGNRLGTTDRSGLLSAYVPSGRHTVVVEKDGFQSATREIDVIETLTERYSFQLIPALVDVTIQANTDGASLYVDGAYKGQTDSEGLLSVELPLGSHELRLEKDGQVLTRRSVRVSASTREIEVVPPEPGFDSEKIVPYILGGLFALCALLALVLGVVAFRRHRPRRRGLTMASFDRYDVLQQLGRGGMATVYLARDRSIDEDVALKVMDASLLQDQDLVRKFVKEGEALQQIAQSAPNAPVVRALRYGRENNSSTGRPFVALEYLQGTTLLNLVRQDGPLPVQHVLCVARQVAEGLAAAHANGIWHRDISPDNVFMVGQDYHGPTVKLIDFGVAKHEFTQVHTLDGSIAGKPAYMSPEQCRGEAVDGRSDIYSVGVMMYTLLTGHPPFTDKNPLIVMKLHENAPPPPLPPSVPKPVAQLVYRLLGKNPGDRPSTAAELAIELYALERMN